MDQEVKERIRGLEGELIALRRDFHAHPELGFEEYRTASIVEEYLRQLGLETTRVAGTGVVATLEGSRPGPVLLLRADLDALPIQEANEVEYASTVDGVMHACGHDAHTAILLVAAKVLCGMREQLEGTVKFVFQPNEEINGALVMVRDGVLENPAVDAGFALHIWSQLPTGVVAATAGPVMGGMDVFHMTIHGQGGHTGFPEEARDPVIAAAAVVQTSQVVPTREISNLAPTTIMFGKIEGGTKSNIIPEEVRLEGTIRYLYDAGPEGPDHPVQRFQRVATSICETYRCTVDFHFVRENLPLVNDPRMTKLARRAAERVVGEEHLTTMQTIASEDFSEFSSRVPCTYLFVGSGNPAKGTDIPHHNPCFNIDEDALPVAVEVFVETVLEYFRDQAARGHPRASAYPNSNPEAAVVGM
jgi:amidohydrolase